MVLVAMRVMQCDARMIRLALERVADVRRSSDIGGVVGPVDRSDAHRCDKRRGRTMRRSAHSTKLYADAQNDDRSASRDGESIVRQPTPRADRNPSPSTRRTPPHIASLDAAQRHPHTRLVHVTHRSNRSGIAENASAKRIVSETEIHAATVAQITMRRAIRSREGQQHHGTQCTMLINTGHRA
jgi:hypothetical protein